VFQDDPALQLINTPQDYVTKVPVDEQLPTFFLAAGAKDQADVAAAAEFRQLLQTRLTSVPFVIIPGVGHQAGVWRAALVPMFSWMTPQLAWEAATADAAEAAAAKAAAYRKAHLPKPRPVRTPGPQKK